MHWVTHNTYTLLVQVEHKGTQIDLASVTAQLPAELASRPADLFDAFAEMLRAGADRMEHRRVLSSTFCFSRNGCARSVNHSPVVDCDSNRLAAAGTRRSIQAVKGR